MDKSMTAAAATGNTREALEQLRDTLAAAIDVADPAIVAQLSGQMVKVLAAIDALPSDKTSKVDDLAKRRADRVAKARASAPANRQRKQRGG